MTNKFLILVTAISMVPMLVSSNAFAGSRKQVRPAAPVEANTGATGENRVITSDPAPGRFSSSNFTYWAGVASDTAVTQSLTPALSLLIGVNDQIAIQTYAFLGKTSPFVFALGADLKYTLVGTSTKGFHIGAGFGLGTIERASVTVGPAGITTSNTTFYCDINALVGLQFELVERVMMNIDAGPTLQIMSNNTDFGIGGHSIAFGLSFLYHI